MRDQGDMRTRIQDVALELFTEQGYEATSLREIAERLKVTKAALYYHYKTKDDIVASLMDDRLASLDSIMEWARGRAGDPDLPSAFVRRYAETLREERHLQLMRFLERNQTALRDNPKSERMRGIFINLLDVLCPPGQPPEARLRTAMSVFTLHAAAFVLRGDEITDAQRHEVGLSVALEMIESAKRVV
jgi:AcrR family transcriptional regulator